MRRTEDCPICRLIRFYLLLAVPLIAIVAIGSRNSDDSGSSKLWFADVALIDFLAYGALAALLMVIGYRSYVEFWLPKRRARALEQMLQDNNGDDEI